MQASSLLPSRAARIQLVILLGIITALDAVAIDMYLPAMPSIQAWFATGSGPIQATLAVFLAGLAIGQMFYGPLAERYGRRLPLLAGMLLFCIGSLLIVFAPTIEVVLFGRLLQALGGAAALVIPRAIVADLYTAAESAKIYSLLMQIMSLGPVLAPLFGNLLYQHFGWHSIFWALSAFGLLSLLGVLLAVPESLPVERRSQQGLLASFLDYRHLLRNRRYMAFSLSGGAITASLFTYIAGAPFVFIDVLQLSPQQFSLVFAGNAIAMMLAGALNVVLLRHYTPGQLLGLGCLLHLVGVVVLTAGQMAGWFSLSAFILLLGFTLGSLGLVWGNVMSLVMDQCREQAGNASALFGVLQYVLGSLAGLLLSLNGNSSALPMLAIMLLCGLIACAGLLASRPSPSSEPGRTHA